MNVKGSFEVQMSAEPPFDTVDGVALGRARFDKQFSGAFEATSRVEMLSVRSEGTQSGAYVAVERISGTLEGKQGSFALVHLGLSNRGERSLTVQIVPESGTGELKSIRGSMTIDITGGKHFYELAYELE
jgi:hypothetical protein